MNCRNCGAPLAEHRCTYCGTEAPGYVDGFSAGLIDVTTIADSSVRLIPGLTVGKTPRREVDLSLHDLLAVKVYRPEVAVTLMEPEPDVRIFWLIIGAVVALPVLSVLAERFL